MPAEVAPPDVIGTWGTVCRHETAENLPPVRLGFTAKQVQRGEVVLQSPIREVPGQALQVAVERRDVGHVAQVAALEVVACELVERPVHDESGLLEAGNRVADPAAEDGEAGGGAFGN